MSDGPVVVEGVRALDASAGRIAIAVGVFDGLHVGHAHLLRKLVEQAHEWRARPAVVTFDAHPDEILRGKAPPLLLDPGERLERIGAAGIDLLVVEHFDDRLRTTPYGEFVRGIASRVDLAGFVMTPESAFGHERRGTPEAVAELGRDLSYQVAVVAPLLVDGKAVSSSAIRRLIAAGDLAAAAGLLGRPYSVVGEVSADGRLSFPLPVALPELGGYPVSVDERPARLEIDATGAQLEGLGAAGSGRLRVVFATGTH